MEVIRLIGSVTRLVEGVRSMVKEDRDLQRNLKAALGYMKDELGLLSGEVEKAWASTKNNQDAEEGMAERWILELQDLAYKIEDFIDERGKDPITSAPVRIVELAMLTDPRQEHVDTIEGFRQHIKNILEIKKQQCPDTTKTGQQVTPVPPEDHPVANPLGMEQSMGDLRGLLMAADGHQSQLKVISILGCSGMGKTTLVRALHEDPAVVQQFSPYLAMVEAPSSSDRNLVSTALQGIMQQVGRRLNAANPDDYDYEKLKTNLKGFLGDKRYLVIIDGVHEYEVWNKIREELPENTLGSRVVITTRNRSVAMGCSSGSYIYTMNGLGGTYPADLFWATFNEQPPAGDDGLDGSRSHWLETLFAKTDGLPLALVDAAEFLRQHGRMLTVEHCSAVGNALGHHIATSGERGFGRMRRSLRQSCHKLSRHAQEMCMMSVSSFPKGHVIKKKSLLRRWIAEGLVVKDTQVDADTVARDCLCKLLDLGIVEPVPRGDITTNIKVKRCQIHGVMLEFLVHRSLSWNFITLIKDGELVPNRETSCAARRLSVHGGVGEVDITTQGIDLSRIRSLTVCNIDGDSSNLTSWEGCKLLRVLDLEGCAWLTDGDLAAICGLLHLKYLSLRNTQVSDLPSAVGNLQCLETLDLRQTGVEGPLPLNVLKLPQLAHLFGKFELPEELGDAQREDELKEVLKRSKLQTLAGFKIVNNPGFTQILCHAKMLKKVKVWCEVPATSPSPSAPPPPPAPAPGPVAPAAAPPPPSCLSIKKLTSKLINAIKKKTTLPRNDVAINLPNGGQVSLPESLVDSLLETRFTGSNSLDSLSIDLGGHCRQFLGSVLNDTCAVSSIKITGEMDMLPDSTVTTLTRLRNIYELHLCNTGLLSQNLSVLQDLHCLIYLKLAENNDGFWQGDFAVTDGGFPHLQRLCFHGPRLPKVNFESGSMRSLLSLQLICPEPADRRLGVTGIIDLKKLDEVILRHDASSDKFEAWKEEADKSWNRPYVKRLLINDDDAH